MFKHHSLAATLKTTVLTTFLAGSTLAQAGTTVRITNTSGQPWNLRVCPQDPVSIMAQTGQQPTPVELNEQQQHPAITIQPGDTCTLQFKEIKKLPMKIKLGLVDQTGTERGQILVKSRAADLTTRIGEVLGRQDTPEAVGGEAQILTSAVPSGEADKILKIQADDAMFILADAWF